MGSVGYTLRICTLAGRKANNECGAEDCKDHPTDWRSIGARVPLLAAGTFKWRLVHVQSNIVRREL